MSNHPEDLCAMLDQTTWYKFSSGSWILISEMSKNERQIAADRLKKFALSFAQTAFRDLYAYGMPDSEQAQWEVERGEAEAEAIMASPESAERWIVQTPLYEALTGRKAPVVPDDLEESYEALAATHEPVRPPLDLEPTVYVGISNTDGKLSMERWQQFCMDTNAVLARHAVGAGTLRWFSPPTEARLSAVFAAKIERALLEDLRHELTKIRLVYGQDEIAFALATEDFIR